MTQELPRNHDTELETMHSTSTGNFRIELDRLRGALRDVTDPGQAKGLAILAVDVARAWSRGVDHDLLAEGIRNVLAIEEYAVDVPGTVYRVESDCEKCKATASMRYVHATLTYACSECPHTVPASVFLAEAKKFFEAQIASLKGGQS